MSNVDNCSMSSLITSATRKVRRGAESVFHGGEHPPENDVRKETPLHTNRFGLIEEIGVMVLQDHLSN